MARPEITGRRTGPPVERLAFTVPEFCEAHRISQSFYYKIRNLGLGPHETRKGEKGDKVLITAESAAAWRNPQTEPA
jgi:hypothetical protein